MISRVYSACPAGVDATLITVEVDVRDNHLKISIVGLPDVATRESRERLIPAISNSGYALLREDIVVNLSPADLRKEGTGYDLPMALGILAAKGIVKPHTFQEFLILGELALDGSLRPIRCVLAAAECARDNGLKGIVVPKGNGNEAAMVANLTVLEASHLAQIVDHFRGKHSLEPVAYRNPKPTAAQTVLDFRDVKGHAAAKRALEIAAAGQHNLLMFGPPGSGKSMLSKRLPGILPVMDDEEILEVTRIFSCAGKLKRGMGPVTTRPFRAPHHTASPAALIGGGTIPKPGEVTLAHRGILFLDEFPEFPRRVLEVLRQPLEDRQVTISRAQQQLTFPANFQLVAAMNPCPCGWRGDPRRRCGCSPHQVSQYRQRISGPMLDRLDLHVEVPIMPLSLLRKLPPAESSSDISKRVIEARVIQRERFQSSLITNATMSAKQLQQYCTLDDGLARSFENHVEKLGFSSRVHAKTLSIARTIADLDGGRSLQEQDLLEAIAYRQLDSQVSTTERKVCS